MAETALRAPAVGAAVLAQAEVWEQSQVPAEQHLANTAVPRLHMLISGVPPVRSSVVTTDYVERCVAKIERSTTLTYFAALKECCLVQA